MKLTAKKVEINHFCVKSIFTINILFLKVSESTTSLRSLGSLFQQVASYKQKIAAQFLICISADLNLYYIAYFRRKVLVYV